MRSCLYWPRGCLGLAWLWWSCMYPSITLAAVVSMPENVTYRVGGLADTGAEAFLESFGPTFSAYLNQTVGEVLPGVGFVAVPLSFEDVWSAVSSATVDFLFLNPGLASCMESEFGTSAILSLRNLRQGMELSEFGGVMITAANRTDITEIDDLQDKIVEGSSISGLGAFQLQWGLVQDAGLNLMTDPSEVRLAYNQRKIVRDIIDGNADVGFVRTDMVAQMDAAGEANLSEVKFVFVREDIVASGFPYPVSTDLVPEWPLQVLPHVPADLTKEVMRALMQLDLTHDAAVSGGYSTWDIPVSYSYLSALQLQLGVLDLEQRRCIQSEDVYGAVVCPDGFFKVTKDAFDSKCSDLGREPCPDGYTCLCRPCVLLPDTEFSFSLRVSGENASTEACEKTATCASGISPFSFVTVLVVDKWGPSRETLGLNNTNTLEVHVIAADDTTAFFAAGYGQFPCSESVVSGGLGAPSINDTKVLRATNQHEHGWESVVAVSVGSAGSTLLSVIVNGENIEASPTVLGVEDPSCGDLVYDARVSSCSNNGSRSVSFHFSDDATQDLCGTYVDLPDGVYDLECDYAPWGSAVGIATVVASAVVTAFAVALTFWTVRHRTAKPIVAAQWIFCVVFSTSVAVVSVEAVFAAGPPTDLTCIAEPIMFNLGCGAAISSICVKMWRVLAVWKAGMKRVKITNTVLFRYLAALLSVDVAVLIAMCLVHPPRASISSTTERVSGVLVDLDHATCGVGHLIFTRILFVYHALIAYFTCLTSFRARKAGSQYMETQSIVATTLTVGMLSILSLSATCDKSCKVLLNSVGTTASATVALVSIYGPKVIWVHFRSLSVHPGSYISSTQPSVGARTHLSVTGKTKRSKVTARSTSYFKNY